MDFRIRNWEDRLKERERESRSYMCMIGMDSDPHPHIKSRESLGPV